jgi:hypothetical protein
MPATVAAAAAINAVLDRSLNPHLPPTNQGVREARAETAVVKFNRYGVCVKAYIQPTQACKVAWVIGDSTGGVLHVCVGSLVDTSGHVASAATHA